MSNDRDKYGKVLVVWNAEWRYFSVALESKREYLPEERAFSLLPRQTPYYAYPWHHTGFGRLLLMHQGIEAWDPWLPCNLIWMPENRNEDHLVMRVIMEL